MCGRHWSAESTSGVWAAGPQPETLGALVRSVLYVWAAIGSLHPSPFATLTEALPAVP